jgi:hypothetical protein
MDISANLTGTLVGVAVLAASTTLVLTLFRVPKMWEPAAAIARARFSSR